MANVFQGLSKCFLFFFNLVFVVAGIILIIVGSSAVSGLRQSQDYTEFNLGYLSAIVFIVAGVVLFLVAFLGCCGALQENECMLLTYASVLFIVCIATVVAFIVFYINRDAAEDFAIKLVDKAIDGSYQNDTGIQDAVDAMQSQLKCCGLNGPKDWDQVLGKGKYPKSCCDDPDEGGFCRRVDYQKSCKEAINDFLNSNQSKLLWVAIISVGSILILFGITCFAMNRRRQEYHYYA